MLHATPETTTSLGADLRALRRQRGLTLARMAVLLGKSVGWLSQVERDISRPDHGDLRRIAGALDVPVSLLFGQPAAPPQEIGHIVRRAARRPIGQPDSGLSEELLSPDLTDDFQVVHCTFAPGAQIDTPVCRSTQEVGYLVSGALDLWIGDVAHTLVAGDSFRVRGDPFRWANPHGEPAVLIWVIAPPVY